MFGIVQDENGHLYKVTSQFYYQHLVDFVQHCILKSINLHHFSLEEVLRVDMGIHPLFIVVFLSIYRAETPRRMSARLRRDSAKPGSLDPPVFSRLQLGSRCLSLREWR